MHHSTLLAIAVSTVLWWGCTMEAPPPEALPPPPEDLSTWALPTLVQPPAPKVLRDLAKPRPATSAEKVYAYEPGGVYKVTVALDAPLDLIFEPGEKVQDMVGSDPKPLPQDVAVPAPEPHEAPEQSLAPQPQAPTNRRGGRWEYREAIHGGGENASTHILLRALESGATLGLTVMTDRRVYYISCRSVPTSPVRAVWWKYPPREFETQAPAETQPMSILPHPDEPRRYHVGYTITTTTPPPAFIPRHIVDDGRKLYLVYSEITLFKAVPLVRALTSQGPAVINARQYLNVVIIDGLPARLELRIGVDHKEQKAEVVTITQGNLKTIDCPGDPDCPVWPAAAPQISAR